MIRKTPEHLKDNTSLVWMFQRDIAENPNWMLEGLTFVATDEAGRFKDIVIKEAFEFFDEQNKLIVLHHPKYTEEDLKPHVKKKILTRYSNLNGQY